MEVVDAGGFVERVERVECVECVDRVDPVDLEPIAAIEFATRSETASQVEWGERMQPAAVPDVCPGWVGAGDGLSARARA